MEQHPVPQQISSYEFRLVGDMTLKQFGKLAAGVVLALLVFSSKLIFFVKWPLVLLFAGGGAAMAFVPFQDRPLELWIKTFFTSVYAPTVYLWQKKGDPDWLKIEKDEGDVMVVQKKVPVVDKSQKVEEYSASLGGIAPNPSFENVKIFGEDKERELVNRLVQDTSSKTQEKSPLNTNKTEEKITQDTNPEPSDKVQTLKDKTQEAMETQEPTKNGVSMDLPKREARDFSGAKEANFEEIPMPKTPDTPNVIAGMVVDQNGKIVEGAIVEIQDEQDNPMRALRSNSLGQFQSATPLANGRYLIVSEKEEMNFDIMKIELKGEVVAPVKIKAIAPPGATESPAVPAHAQQS